MRKLRLSEVGDLSLVTHLPKIKNENKKKNQSVDPWLSPIKSLAYVDPWESW